MRRHQTLPQHEPPPRASAAPPPAATLQQASSIEVRRTAARAADGGGGVGVFDEGLGVCHGLGLVIGGSEYRDAR